MKLIHCILSISLIYALSCYAIPVGYAKNKLDIRAWIASHKDASSHEIDSFLKKEFLKKVKNLKEAYAALDDIIQTYSASIIPTSVYTTYAHFAQLSFDFRKALNMYLRAYQNTKEEQYLIQISIHALEAGDVKTAFSYITHAQRMNLSDKQRIVLNITQAKILIQDGQPDIALASLQTLPFLIDKKKLTSNFYYALYQVAKRNGKKTEANLAHQILTEQFPYSVEVYMLNSLRVQPLPLPSQIFTLYSKIFNDIETDSQLSKIPKNVKPSSLQASKQKNNIQDIPKVGYQVAAFTDIVNAQTAFEYYYNLWSSFDKDAIRSPVITQKDVSGLRFYQIIFPFDDAIIHDSKQQHEMLKKLREHNIEGGFIITQ